jgi:hypothetical protein
MAMRFLFGKNKSTNKPHIFNVDDNGSLKVIANDNYDLNKLREQDCCYIVNHSKLDRKTYTNMLIYNPSNSNYTIYIYNIELNITSPNSNNLTSTLALSRTHDISNFGGNKLNYSSLLLNDNNGDDIVFYNVNVMQATDIYKHSFIETGNYNYNCNIPEMVEIKPNNGLLLKLNYHNKDSVYNINVKFIKLPN